MCLGIPGKLVEKKDDLNGIVDFGEVTKEISLRLLPEAEAGDYVLVHAGFALQVIDEKDAAETIRILDELVMNQENDA